MLFDISTYGGKQDISISMTKQEAEEFLACVDSYRNLSRTHEASDAEDIVITFDYSVRQQLKKFDDSHLTKAP